MAGIHHHHRASMFGAVGVHGMNEADVINQFAHMRKDVADPLAAFSVLTKPIRRRHQPVLCVAK
jgi:hypothetical protein